MGIRRGTAGRQGVAIRRGAGEGGARAGWGRAHGQLGRGGRRRGCRESQLLGRYSVRVDHGRRAAQQQNSMEFQAATQTNRHHLTDIADNITLHTTHRAARKTEPLVKRAASPFGQRPPPTFKTLSPKYSSLNL